MISENADLEKNFPPGRLDKVVDSVHWHWSLWISKGDLYLALTPFLAEFPEMSELDHVIRAYLEKVAREEKARVLGYSTDDEVFYTAGVIARLLPVALELEEALQPHYDPEADHRGGGGDYGDFVTSLLDVRRAWIGTTFRNSEMRILMARYVRDWEWDKIAASYGMTPDEVQRQAAVGLRRMVEFLGGKDPRKVLEHGPKGN